MLYDNIKKEMVVKMSKYEPLGKYLEKTGENYVSLTFSQIEEILGFELIKSLKKYPVSWYGTAEGSPTHVWKVIWCSYGYQVDTVDLDAQKVTFYKV